MLLANARSDVMFAHYAFRRNIIHAVNITDEVNITCPQGQTSFKKATKKIFLEVCNKDLNPRKINEIVRCTMKSSLGSDEIFSLRLQMKSNPPIFCRKADFIAKRFHPPQVDLFRKRRI